jgi:hypothetical protein
MARLKMEQLNEHETTQGPLRTLRDLGGPVMDQEAGFNLHILEPVEPAALEKLLAGLQAATASWSAELCSTPNA